MTNHPSFRPTGVTLQDLLEIRDQLGIKATTIEKNPDGGFRIDWNGDVEDFATGEAAVTALREMGR